ncbi:MAG: DUF4959 domain-containing protein [Prevotellaceae bacterium]|jgi:hypothetical protein|nr:DUF4959 domain-containing protein [Prevotellaceae bacterium]
MEEKRPEIVMDSVPPAPVTDVQVQNIPGGAVLKYQLPDDEDLLYVKALYSLKEGRQAEVRASLYCDTLTIKGFGDEQEREVQIVAVDRSKNESVPVKVTVNPLEPPVLAIRKTLTMYPEFGGVHLYWENPTRTEISVILERKDSIGDYEQVDRFYSSVVNGDVASRGMDTITSDFRAYVQDRWENQSAPLDTILTPMFEMKFDRTKFQALRMPDDQPDSWGWVLTRMFDGDTNTGFHTEGSGMPQWWTFDMGIKGKISRIKIWQRSGGYEYNHGNLKRFELWGTNDAANLGDWNAYTRLIECENIKPSGLPLGQMNAEDNARIAEGDEYPCPSNAPEVRYLRIKALESWSGGYQCYIMEIEIYGKEVEE